MGCINCDLCKHKRTEVCDDCSTNLKGCSCHVSPPCTACTQSKFED